MHEFAYSRENFCRDTGIDPFYLKQIFKQQREITYDCLLKICTAYPVINTQWLILGIGAVKVQNEMDRSDNAMNISVRILENQKVKLQIRRDDESFYRQDGTLIQQRVAYYQSKYRITETRALQVTAYILAIQLAEPKTTLAAFSLLKSTSDLYAKKVRPENLQAALTFAIAFQYGRLLGF
jgi:hypothetical protein